MEGKKEVAWNQYEDVIKPHLSRDTLHNMYARWANSYDQVSSTGVCSSVHHKQQNCEKCMNLCTMCHGTFRNSRTPADLYALGPGYEFRPDLVTIPQTPQCMQFAPPEPATSDRTFGTTLLAP